jgi:hypothetical protein
MEGIWIHSGPCGILYGFSVKEFHGIVPTNYFPLIFAHSNNQY